MCGSDSRHLRGAESAAPAYQEAVANGGFKTHIKRVGQHDALCGYAPSSPNAHMFYRGRWKSRSPLDIDGQRIRWCRRCRIAYFRETEQFGRMMAE